MKIELQRVRYMSQKLEPGVLYVSEEFGIAALFAPADAAPRSGPRWAQPSGLLTKRAADRVCALP